MRLVWDSIYFPIETIFYMVVSPLADTQKAVKCITNQKALQSQTIPYNRVSNKSAATMEITTLFLGEVAREQDRAPVLKPHQALAWGSKCSPEEEEQTCLRLLSPWGAWDGLRPRTEREL